MESGIPADAKLGELFQACDLDGSGYIEKAELASICTDLTETELSDIFQQLDTDGDGRITVEEFAKSFNDISAVLSSSGARNRKRRRSRNQTVRRGNETRALGMDEVEEEVAENNRNEECVAENMTLSLDDNLETISCQEQIVELYQQLHAADNADMLSTFEGVILGVLTDIRQYKQENERLANTFKKEKEQHDTHLKQLEDEMESQVEKIEKRLRQKVNTEMSDEKELLKVSLESEIDTLKHKLVNLEQLEEFANRENLTQDQIANMRDSVNHLHQENRHLQSELTDAQTGLALNKSQMTALKQTYNDKLHELNVERDTVMDYIREQDNLTRQLHMLHDANKKLHDTNDDLREALEKSRRESPRYHTKCPVSPAYDQSKRGSIISDYLDDPFSNSISNQSSSLAEEFLLARASQALKRAQRLSPQGSCDVDSQGEDVGMGDSGLSTLRDINDADEESEYPAVEDMRRRRRRQKRTRATHTSDHEGGEYYSNDEQELVTLSENQMDTTIDDVDGDLLRLSHDFQRPSSAGSRRSYRSNFSRDGSFTSQRSNRRTLPMIPTEALPVHTVEPERMYKVVLAGDAAVGKSSFIMRLCKGKFFSNLTSTLGVDFQTKVLEVDGRPVALQLWDTAGQERFRSIAKSYFRRADGVLLLYDCTHERSFLNVREWITAIEENSQKKIPVMICANKTDIREEMCQTGRRVVQYNDGLRLCREFDTLFIETSAKDGGNITEAIEELTRLLRTNEDLEVKSVGMQLQEIQSKSRSNSCCKR